MTDAATVGGAAVQIELATELEQCIAAGGGDLESSVLRELAPLAERLGVPAPVRVERPPARSSRAVRLAVDGQILAFSLAILRRAWLACAPDELHDLPLTDPESATGIPDNWLRLYASEDFRDARQHPAATIATYVARLVSDALALHPAALVTNDWAASYLDPPDGTFTSEESARTLRSLLELGLSLRDREQIRKLAISCRAAGAEVDALVEEVFARLAPRTIEVLIASEWLNQVPADGYAETSVHLSDDEQPAGLRSIASAVEQRMAELGVTRTVRLSAADELEPGQIRVRVNDRVGQPIPVARPDEVAVQVPPSSLSAYGSAARLLVDAASGHQLVALPAADAAVVEQDGFAPLSPEAFLVVAIVREVTPLANRLVDIEDVDCDLADVELSHPDLVHSALRRHSRARITQVFRGLLAEQVSIRDVWMILNALVRFESIPLPPPGMRLFDNRVAVANPELSASEAPVSDLVAFVRLQMKGPLTWDSGQPGGERHQLDAYTIDAQLEAALRRRMDQRHWTCDDDDELRRSVGRALGLAGSPADAVLLVPAGVRVALHEALAGEFPSLRVIARTEVPPETSVKVHHVLGLD